MFPQIHTWANGSSVEAAAGQRGPYRDRIISLAPHARAPMPCRAQPRARVQLLRVMSICAIAGIQRARAEGSLGIGRGYSF